MFFFNDTATTEIYTLSLHDALPIWRHPQVLGDPAGQVDLGSLVRDRRKALRQVDLRRSEEHTSELQSRQYLVCRLLLEKKNYYPSHCLAYHLILDVSHYFRA